MITTSQVRGEHYGYRDLVLWTQQGLMGAMGVTGHGLQIAASHRRSLERFDFDSVLLPFNFITMRNANSAMWRCKRSSPLPTNPG
ncbi:MAG TPA: hypothetical protein VFB60_02350 [Ktedonobacteraceae bacterium]|nr:hypothetical protein [Ktedonobacteraceae bacterium]